jgi:hypothetical protein
VPSEISAGCWAFSGSGGHVRQGAEKRAGRKFRVECDGQLALNCMVCGTPPAAEEKFCGECGLRPALPRPPRL